MKTTTSAIVLLGFFGLLAGCSTAPAEPAPGPAQTSPGSAVSGVPLMGGHPADVRASPAAGASHARVEARARQREDEREQHEEGRLPAGVVDVRLVPREKAEEIHPWPRSTRDSPAVWDASTTIHSIR